jgi:UDP:flavonoid glycosyltransferase YjiC (YdhE family)
MKVAFVVPPLAGHTLPTVSIAAALRERGHQVAWAGHPESLERLLPGGAEVWSLGALPAGVVAAIEERSRRLRGLESVQFLWQDFLVPLARATRPLLERLLGERSPDVVVVDQQALGGALAARRLGACWATLCTTSAALVAPYAAFPKVAAWIDAQLAGLHEQAGLAPASELSPELVLVLSTRALVGDRPLPPQARLCGPAFTGRVDDTPMPRLAPGRRVLVSLGTVSAERGGGFYRAVVEAFAGGELQAIVVAPPELVGPAPDNVIVAARVPQLALLPHVDAVVTHGGHNTVCEALAHGLPLVVAPIRDDQPIVAQQVVDAGAGLRVRFGGLSAATLGAAVRRVLDEPGFRAAAARVRASFADAGGAPEAARLIEALRG